MGGRGDERRVRAAAGAEADAGSRLSARGDPRRPHAWTVRGRGAAGGGAAAQVQGRWSLTAPLFAGERRSGCAPAGAGELLLERYGILTREQVLAEGVPGGFSAIYSELSQLETLGVARRGYFVEGLGGAQFALPGAVERLRAGRSSETMARRSCSRRSIPAQPYGAALPWPVARARRGAGRRPSRVAGAYVVLAGGEPIALPRARRARAADARRGR